MARAVRSQLLALLGRVGANTNERDAGRVREEFFEATNRSTKLLASREISRERQGGLPVCLLADRALLWFGKSLLENLMKAAALMVYH
jgi:hypothetical protein